MMNDTRMSIRYFANQSPASRPAEMHGFKGLGFTQGLLCSSLLPKKALHVRVEALNP